MQSSRDREARADTDKFLHLDLTERLQCFDQVLQCGREEDMTCGLQDTVCPLRCCVRRPPRL